LDLADNPRALTAEEASALVDAWRAVEHRKHIALMEVPVEREKPAEGSA